MPALDFSALEAEVARNQTVDGSAVALINGFIAELEKLNLENAAEQAQLDGIVQGMKDSTDALAAAVAAGTT